MPFLIKSKSKIVILTLLLITVVVAVSVIYSSSNDSRQVTTVKDVNTVDYSGPSDEETLAGDEQKEIIIENEKQADQFTPVTNADVRITDSMQYGSTVEVRGLVTNVYEDGECTVNFEKSGFPSVSTTTAAFKDASTTQCGANDTSRSKFTSTGVWKVTLTYTSASGVKGTTQSEVEIM